MFWNSLSNLDNNEPLIHAISLVKHYKLKEVNYYENLVNNYESPEEIRTEFVESIKDNISQKAEKGQSKYKTYLEVNPELTKPAMYEKINHQSSVTMKFTEYRGRHGLRGLSWSNARIKCISAQMRDV